MKKKWLAWLPALLAAAIMLYLTSLPRKETMGLSLAVQNWFISLFPQGQAPTWLKDSHLVRSLAHVPEYGILACCIYLGFFCSGEKAARRTILTGTAAGLAEELLKGILPARHFELRDWGLDVLGVVLGTAVMLLLFRPLRHGRSG